MRQSTWWRGNIKRCCSCYTWISRASTWSFNILVLDDSSFGEILIAVACFGIDGNPVVQEPLQLRRSSLPFPNMISKQLIISDAADEICHESHLAIFLKLVLVCSLAHPIKGYAMLRWATTCAQPLDSLWLQLPCLFHGSHGIWHHLDMFGSSQ